MTDPARRRPAHLELLAISWNFGWPITAGVAMGYWLDQKSGMSPALTLLFGLGALVTSVRRMLELGRKDVAERREEEKGQS